MAATSEPRGRSGSRVLLRVGLLLASTTALWFAANPIFLRASAATVEAIRARELAAIVLGIIAGFLAGLAVFLPERWNGYRWRTALQVLAVPVVVLAYTVILSLTVQRVPSPWLLGHWLWPLLDEAPQLGLAVIVGVAVNSGFSFRSRT